MEQDNEAYVRAVHDKGLTSRRAGDRRGARAGRPHRREIVLPPGGASSLPSATSAAIASARRAT
jgi:hypothetical protein